MSCVMGSVLKGENKQHTTDQRLQKAAIKDYQSIKSNHLSVIIHFIINSSLYLLQELLKTSPSLVLPAVDCHTINHLSDYLQESLNWTVVHVDGLDLPHLTVNVSRPNIFVINLHQTKRTNELSLQKELMENDQIIGSFARALQQEGIQASFIYTARRPSRVPMKLDLAWHSRRQLMSAEDQGNDKYQPLNVTNDVNGTTCILFYATNFSLTYMADEKTIVALNLTDLTFMHQKVDTSSSKCSENNATLSLKYANVSSIKNLEIRFVMTNKFYKGSARNWFTLDFVYIQKDDESVVQFNVTDISGPAEYSFHCQLVGTGHHQGVTLIPKDDKQQKWEIGISEFQIQAFNVKNITFAYASDCTSFFTPAIWMGLVTSFVLLLILTYGIHMITNLTTNSRFDDPKGPALSIPQTE
nr:PREDICTED: V-type proton ATPase subunit S1 [Anolis carolinensis]|eukprot:XP_016849664.1 PREDICTED: V-type proton ATPase subunit S1 [Anolis carolinensis]